MRRSFPTILQQLADNAVGVPRRLEGLDDLIAEARAAAVHEASPEVLALALLPRLRSMARVAYEGPENGDARALWRAAEALEQVYGQPVAPLLAGASRWTRSNPPDPHTLVVIGPDPSLVLVDMELEPYDDAELARRAELARQTCPRRCWECNPMELHHLIPEVRGADQCLLVCKHCDAAVLLPEDEPDPDDTEGGPVVQLTDEVPW